MVRAECVNEWVSLESSLTTGLPPPVPPLGDFSQSFPDVADLAKHLEILSIKDLETFFHKEMARSGQTIELPAVKLPGEAVTSWGIVILVAIEAYFFAIFREFCCRVTPGDKAWTVPWLGISRDIVSKVTFSISMLIVLGTVGYLAWCGARITPGVWMMVLYTASFVVSVAVVSLVLRGWASLVVGKGAMALDERRL